MNTIGVAFAYAVLALFAQNAIFIPWSGRVAPDPAGG